MQKLICSYLANLAQSVDAENIYSVGSHCTNLSTQQPMQYYSFDLSEADSVLFPTYAVLRESGNSDPVVVDAADTDAYVALPVILQQLCSELRLSRKTVFCRGLVTNEIADGVVQLHCLTGCDTNSGFYGKGRKVAKNPVALRQLIEF